MKTKILLILLFIGSYAFAQCEPQNIQIINIGQTTADVTWNAPTTTTTRWEIALVPAAQPLSNGSYFTSYTNSFSLTGMNPSTPYDVYVRAVCSGVYSSWTTPIMFISQSLPSYVDLNATAGTLDGTSWTNAYTNIQDAIDNATSGQQIWVSQGTYYPTTTNADSRKATYEIDKILEIYGGFQGYESQVSQRDASVNITILSGDLNGNDTSNIEENEATRSDNSYHVVTLKGDFNAGTIIDGFTITGGNANGTLYHVSGGAGFDDQSGGAIYPNPVHLNNKVSAVIKNCIIEKNTAIKHAVMGTYSPSGTTGSYSKIDFISTIIQNNSSERSILAFNASAFYGNSRFGDFINCLITDNDNTDATYAGVLTAGSTTVSTAPTTAINIINTTIANNTSLSGDIIALNNMDVYSSVNNSIIYNNGGTTLMNISGTNVLTSSNSIIEGAHLGAINNDPKFKDIGNADYSLDNISPAIDTGSNALLSATITKDVAGNDRIENSIIDMGALEYKTVHVYYDLTVSKIGNGVVTPIVGVHNYVDGSVVSLSVTPATGWVFDKWSGDIASTNSSETITINANKAVTAEFKQIQHTLTVNTNGSGTVTRSLQPVNGTYSYGTGVTLTANPSAGYQFDGWSGASNQLVTSTVIIMDADKTVTANFSIIQYELTIIENDGVVTPNTGTLTGGVYIYNIGTIVEIAAVANTGFIFDHYEITDSIGTTTDTSNPLSLTMNDFITVEAIFTAVYDLTISSVGSGSVSPSGTTTYNDGTSVVITAVPNSGNVFVRFETTDTVTGITTNSATNPLTVLMDSTYSVEAIFTSTAGIEDVLKASFNLYPNPVNNILNVELDADIQSIEVFSLLGRKVLESNSKQINVSKLEVGIYLVRIKTKSDLLVSKKFIKK